MMLATAKLLHGSRKGIGELRHEHALLVPGLSEAHQVPSLAMWKRQKQSRSTVNTSLLGIFSYAMLRTLTVDIFGVSAYFSFGSHHFWSGINWRDRTLGVRLMARRATYRFTASVAVPLWVTL